MLHYFYVQFGETKVMYHILVEGTDEHRMLFEAAMQGKKCPVFKGIVKAERGFCLDQKDQSGEGSLVALGALQRQKGDFFLAVRIEHELGLLVKTSIQEVSSGAFRAAFHHTTDGPWLIIRPTISADPRVVTAWGDEWRKWRKQGLPDSREDAQLLLQLARGYRGSLWWRLNKAATIAWFLPYVLFG